MGQPQAAQVINGRRCNTHDWLITISLIAAIAIMVISALASSVTAATDMKAGLGQDPSFDCLNPRAGAEKLICSDPELAKAHVEMSQAYDAAKEVQNKAALGEEQLQWTRNVRDVCKDVMCMLEAYRKRTNELTAKVKIDSACIPKRERINKDYCYKFDWQPWLVKLEKSVVGDKYESLEHDTFVATPGEMVEANGKEYMFFGACRPHECSTTYAYFIVDPAKPEMNIVWFRDSEPPQVLGPSSTLIKVESDEINGLRHMKTYFSGSVIVEY